jgi:drug/metabolite transporter (DMT)-like permease
MKNKVFSAKGKALATIICCVLFWGFSFVSTKIAIVVFPPMSLGMLRFAIALIFLYFIKLKLAPSEKLRVRDIPMLCAAGLFGVTLYFFFENNGIALVSASEASIAVSSIPVLIMITEWISGKIKAFKRKSDNSGNFEYPTLRGRQWIGCFISIAGVWLVAGVSFAISGSIRGYIYMTGAAFSWVAYSFLTRSLFSRCSVIYIVFWQSLAGFICFIPFSVMELKNWGEPEINVIAHVVFLAVFCSALGHWFYVKAMETLNVTISGIFLNLIPVITVIAGFFTLGDRLTLLQWLGAALVIAGVYLAMWKSSSKNSSQKDAKV